MALVYSLFLFKENITTNQWVYIMFVCLGLILNLFKGMGKGSVYQ